MEIEAPYLPYDVLRQRAEQFLSQYHSSRETPVPIEEIVEFQFEMDIVPEPGLHEHFDVDSYITALSENWITSTGQNHEGFGQLDDFLWQTPHAGNRQ